jgi:hypothetical protein
MSNHQPIFVFGSNEAGRHGKGAALFAREQRGAIYGQGEGLQGKSYGIPTKDGNLRSLPIKEIAQGVERFLAFATAHPNMPFEITPIGCGHAGYTADQIAPLFAEAPRNCQLPEAFVAILGKRCSSDPRQCERDLDACAGLLRRLADALQAETPAHPLAGEAFELLTQIGHSTMPASGSRVAPLPKRSGAPDHLQEAPCTQRCSSSGN